MGKAGAEDGGAGVDIRPVGQRGAEIAGTADEGLDRGVRPDIDQPIALDPLDHAADGVLGPLAGRHQFGVARQDRRAAELVGFFDQHDPLPGAGQRMRGRQAGWTTTNNEDRAIHSAPPESAATAVGLT